MTAKISIYRKLSLFLFCVAVKKVNTVKSTVRAYSVSELASTLSKFLPFLRKDHQQRLFLVENRIIRDGQVL